MARTLLPLTLLFLSAAAQTVKIPTPSNLSVSWENRFRPNISWVSHHPRPNCEDRITVRASDRCYKEVLTVSHWSGCFSMNGSSLIFDVTTVCGSEESETARLDVSNPVLLKDLRCQIRSSKETRCSWLPANDTQGLRFYFRLVDERGGEDEAQRECPSYTASEHGRSGCLLRMKTYHSIFMLFNGTRGGRNSFGTYENQDVTVKPAALNWTAVETTDTLKFSWVPPDVLDLDRWKFTLEYTECGEKKSKEVRQAVTTEIPRVAHCKYRIRIQAGSSRGSSDWSEEVKFDARVDNTVVYAAILFPLLLGGLTVLAFACCRKNKDKIFPKIPKPRNLLSDIYENNKYNLCAPTKEENFKISLVIDPQLSKPGT